MLDSLGIASREQLIVDGGPFYHEFEVDSFLREPWNTYSSMLFFIPVIFWMIKLRGEYRKHLIFLIILPLLFLNGLGSTLYHATRSSQLFLYLDSLPAGLMNLALASYFWSILLKKWWKGLMVVLSSFLIGFIITKFLVSFESLSEMGPNIAYLIVGLVFFTPILILSLKSNWYKFKFVILTIIFLSLALLCRVADHPSDVLLPTILPHGTHFLWHLFSMLAVFSMGYYVYYVNKSPDKIVLDGEIRKE